VGKYVARMFEAERAETKQQIETLVKKLQEPVLAELPSLTPVPANPNAETMIEADAPADAPETQGPLATPMRADTHPSRARAVISVALGAVVAIAAIVYFTRPTRTRSEPPAAAAPPPPPPVSAPGSIASSPPPPASSAPPVASSAPSASAKPRAAPAPPPPSTTARPLPSDLRPLDTTNPFRN
jgi:hypothetical protein